MSAYEMATQRSGATHVKTTGMSLVDDVQAHEIDVYWYVFNRYPLCPTTISARIWTHYPREPHHDMPSKSASRHFHIPHALPIRQQTLPCSQTSKHTTYHTKNNTIVEVVYTFFGGDS